jgi:DNA polymerase elongation subunit (family B)
MAAIKEVSAEHSNNDVDENYNGNIYDIDPAIKPAIPYDTLHTNCVGPLLPNEIGTRDNLLNPEQKAAVNRRLENGRALLFMPNTIEESNSDNAYVMNLYGVLTDGSKTHVMITKVKPFFDVILDDDTVIKQRRKLASLRDDNDDNDDNDDIHMCIELAAATGVKAACGSGCTFAVKKLIPLHGLIEEPKLCIRVYAKNSWTRKRAIEGVRIKGFQTANDDRPTTHHRKLARDLNITLCNWVRISSYTVGNITDSTNKAAHTIIVDYDIDEIRAVVDPIEPTQRGEEYIASRDSLLNEKILVCVWDIETATKRPDGPVPLAEFHETDSVFMICLALFWRGRDAPLRNFCLTTSECAKIPPGNWDVLIFDNERNMILGFAELLARYNPDIMSGFNDTIYDWPFIITKARAYNIVIALLDGISIAGRRQGQSVASYEKYGIRDRHEIKVAATMNQYATYPCVPGVLCIDTRIAYMKIYPRSERTSLKYFLDKEGLGSKADMPYQTMFKIHRENDVEGMSRVAHYCLVDAIRCQQLLNAQNIVDSARQIAVLSYCSLYDAIFYANGAKVVNMVAAYGIRRSIVVSIPWADYDVDVEAEEFNEETGKKKKAFEGGYVFEPVKGPVKRPTTGLDFESLYPSLMMTYNLSTEKITTSREQVERMRANGRTFHEIKGEAGGTPILAWTLMHDNVEDNIGLFPSILIRLKTSRKTLKDERDDIKSRIKKGEYADDAEKLMLTCKYNMYDSKQKAAKVYMNTFYGVTGFDKSPLYRLEVAYGTTMAGQYNIRAVEKFVLDKGHKIMYGDTDSVYVACNDNDFVKMDATYAASDRGVEARRVYWTDMIRHSIHRMADLAVEINDNLYIMTGSSYLQVAKEGTEYPMVLTGKKKYFGLEHEKTNEITFDDISDKRLMVKGIDVVKQGKSKLLRNIGYEIMRTFVDINRTDDERDLHTLTFAIITRTITQKEWKFDDFITSYPYRRDTNNLTVAKFVAKLVARGDKPPEYGERFQCVVVPRETEYDAKGRTIKFAMGDCLEYADYARNNMIDPDIKYYLTNHVIGLCARFIAYAPQYQNVADTDLAYKVIDNHTFLAAKRDLRTLVDRVVRNTSISGLSKEEETANRLVCKHAYVAGQDTAFASLVASTSASTAEIIHGHWKISAKALETKSDTGERGAVIIFVRDMIENIKKESIILADTDLLKKQPMELAHAIGIDSVGFDIEPTQGAKKSATLILKIHGSTRVNSTTNTLYKKKIRDIDTELMALRRELIGGAPGYLRLLEHYNTYVESTVMRERNNEELEPFEMEVDLQDSASMVMRIWDRMLSLETVKIEFISFSNLIGSMYNRRFGATSGDVRESCRF